MIIDESRVDEVLKALEELDGWTIDVGVIGEGGKYEDSKVTVLDVAKFNEYGTSNIPARPFIRGAYDSYKDDLTDMMFKYSSAVINGDMAVSMLNKGVGQASADYTREYLTDLSNPPNSPITIKLKGSSNPLIDTGQLRDSIDYEVSKK